MQRVIPTILTSDPQELRQQLELLKNNTKWVHVDIMDGKFVPNTSVNLFELGEAAQFFNLEIHLMVEQPEKYLEDCKGIAAKRVIFHVEATDDLAAVLKKMEEYGFQKEIALNPATAVSAVAPHIKEAHAVLLMSVHPGFQGQEFIADVLSKVSQVRALKEDILIGLDGGVGKENITDIFSHQVDYVGVGSSVFKTSDPVSALKELEQMVQ